MEERKPLPSEIKDSLLDIPRFPNVDRTMKYKTIVSLSSLSVLLLAGCETMQTPQQHREAQARQLAAQRHAEEQVYRVRGQVETVEMENARMVQEVQQLRADVRSLNSQVGSLNAKMGALEAKQKREMDELIRRVEALLKKSVASRPSSSSQHQGGYEHEVQSGHTLSTIAAKYGTTVSAIMKANNLKSDQIYVGQKLFIPQ